MANQINTNDSREIDLDQVSRKVRGYFSRVNDSFFDGILFVKRNFIIIAILIVGGAAYGIYKDSLTHRYKNNVLLIPNFNSVDYLYEEVDNINSKLNQSNSDFLKQTGINKTKKLVKLEIEPVVDIYDFIDNPDKEKEENDRTFQLFKLISESGNMDKMLEEEVTSKNYKNHLLTITTKGETSFENDVKPLLDYLNANPYYQQMQEEYINNLNLKIAANDTIIRQIDAILNDFSKTSGKGTNLMYYNDNTELNEVIKLKDRLTREQGRNRIDKVNFNKIIKDSSMTLNMKDTSLIAGTMKFLVPVLLLLLFIAVVKFRNYYRSQMNKRKLIIANE
jgi:hypothetical protein